MWEEEKWARGFESRKWCGCYSDTPALYGRLFDYVYHHSACELDERLGIYGSGSESLACLIGWYRSNLKKSSSVLDGDIKDGSVHSAHEHLFSWQGLKTLVQILVSNTYLVNGQLISHQILGIPMGTNCAPILANLF